MAMKTFTRRRTADEISKLCQERGFEIDTQKYEEGSDCITFEFRHGRTKLKVVYNTVNGRALFEYKGELLSTDSTQFEGRGWFEALLNFIYVP